MLLKGSYAILSESWFRRIKLEERYFKACNYGKNAQVPLCRNDNECNLCI